jgi:hypothetical protein
MAGRACAFATSMWSQSLEKVKVGCIRRHNRVHGRDSLWSKRPKHISVTPATNLRSFSQTGRQVKVAQRILLLQSSTWRFCAIDNYQRMVSDRIPGKMNRNTRLLPHGVIESFTPQRVPATGFAYSCNLDSCHGYRHIDSFSGDHVYLVSPKPLLGCASLSFLGTVAELLYTFRTWQLRSQPC